MALFKLCTELWVITEHGTLYTLEYRSLRLRKKKKKKEISKRIQNVECAQDAVLLGPFINVNIFNCGKVECSPCLIC